MSSGDGDIPIFGQEDAPRGQHIMDALNGNAKGMPDLGNALATVRQSRALGLQLREALAQPEEWEPEAEMIAAIAEVETFMRNEYKGHQISIRVHGEGFVGCRILHYVVNVDGWKFHTERVVTIGSVPRPESEYPDAELEVYQFMMFALGAGPAQTHQTA